MMLLAKRVNAEALVVRVIYAGLALQRIKIASTRFRASFSSIMISPESSRLYFNTPIFILRKRAGAAP
jgi:hypothetical protein